MSSAEIEQQCEVGQRLLMEMEYLEAERVLADAESCAWEARDWDLLSRLYLPLQETRRQRRQRCGEGTVCLDLAARSASEIINPAAIVTDVQHGQLLIAGWGTIRPAVQVRELAARQKLYLDTFLAAVYPVANNRVMVIVPRVDDPLPATAPQTIDELRQVLPENALILLPGELPTGKIRGSVQTYALTMSLWERLHAPFLARAETAGDPLERMRLFRDTITVDYACELAHQHLAAVASQLRRHDGSSR